MNDPADRTFVFSTVGELRQRLRALRVRGLSVGAVPTMGALHAGHLSLIEAARKVTDEVVVTIFVNPTQFGPDEDLEKYPRNLAADVQLAASAGASCVFAPSVSEMYPPDERTRVSVARLSEGLCGAARPEHFQGVATIVAKLFNVVGEATYFFGRKDYQQLRVVEKLATDLLFPARIVGCPIVREEDGLALSSRNRYLNQQQRAAATAVPRGLKKAWSAYRSGLRKRDELVGIFERELQASGLQAQYAEIRSAQDLTLRPAHLDDKQGASLLAVAAFVGSTRLIDNVVLGASGMDSFMEQTA